MKRGDFFWKIVRHKYCSNLGKRFAWVANALHALAEMKWVAGSTECYDDDAKLREALADDTKKPNSHDPKILKIKKDIIAALFNAKVRNRNLEKLKLIKVHLHQNPCIHALLSDCLFATTETVPALRFQLPHHTKNKISRRVRFQSSGKPKLRVNPSKIFCMNL
jgi:hypothetical protein